jgi:PAS domain S-box-containing protein
MGAFDPANDTVTHQPLSPVQILLLEDSAIDAELLELHLARSGLPFVLHCVSTRADYMLAIGRGGFDIILADYSLPDFDGITALQVARARVPDVPFLFVSGVVGEEFATDALKQGATDYILKRNLLRLPAALERALAEAHERRERRRVEAALLESEVRMRLAVSAARIATWDYDPVTDTVLWIRQAEGSTREVSADLAAALSKVHPADRPALDRAIEAAFNPVGDGRILCEYRLLRPQGAERWIVIHGQAFFRDGVCTRAVGITQDVTDRKATEAALSRLNEMLARELVDRTRERDRIWQLSRDLLIVCDAKSRPVVLNPAWTDLLGWPQETLLARKVTELVHDDDLPGLRALARFGASETLRVENRLRCQDGTYRWIAWTAVRDDGLFYAIGRDVTEQKQAAEELAETNHQLLMQIEERARMETTLHQMQRLEAVGQLTSGVAHDFNNLLTVILGNLTFLERDLKPVDPPEAVARRIAQMTKAAERGALLTNQLLAFSRRQRLEPKALDLNETVAGMSDLLQSTMGGSVQFRMALHDAPWRALVDPTQIELIILNLAINARDAMDVGGSLTIVTDNVTLSGIPGRPEEPGPGEYVMLAVADTGSGMTEEVLAKAFEPFFTTKEVGRGSGLGLAQVYGFAKQSGGGVGIETEPGSGTTVRVYLPRAMEAAPAPEAAPAADRMPPDEVKRHVVLLVDDDSAVREVTATMLQDLGYEVVEASGGAAALDVLAREPRIAVVVLDYAMPGMSGAEVAREVNRRRPELPALFITGYADLGALRAVGEDRIVQKPFRASELAEKLRATLRNAYGALA